MNHPASRDTLPEIELVAVQHLRPITREHAIAAAVYCSRCYDELPYGVAPSEYARVECGFTEIGFQVWCTRHRINVVHTDFCGHQAVSNSSACAADGLPPGPPTLLFPLDHPDFVAAEAEVMCGALHRLASDHGYAGAWLELANTTAGAHFTWLVMLAKWWAETELGKEQAQAEEAA